MWIHDVLAENSMESTVNVSLPVFLVRDRLMIDRDYGSYLFWVISAECLDVKVSLHKPSVKMQWHRFTDFLSSPSA